MALSRVNHKIDTREFMKPQPELQNFDAKFKDDKDNMEDLTSSALSGINKQLYDYIANALALTFTNVIESQTIQFKKLCQEVYSNVVRIIEGKAEDGELAEALLSKLDFPGGSQSEGELTESGGEVPSTPVEGQDESGQVEASPVESKEIDIQKTILQQKETHEKNIEHETSIIKEQEIRKTDVNVQKEVNVIENHEVESVSTEGLEDTAAQLDEAISSSNEQAASLEEIEQKLRLFFVYLRSQKVDVFKLLASTDEEIQGENDTQELIDLEYEQEMKRRAQLRKDFHKLFELDSEEFNKQMDLLSAGKPTSETKKFVERQSETPPQAAEETKQLQQREQPIAENQQAPQEEQEEKPKEQTQKQPHEQPQQSLPQRMGVVGFIGSILGIQPKSKEEKQKKEEDKKQNKVDKKPSLIRRVTQSVKKFFSGKKQPIVINLYTMEGAGWVGAHVRKGGKTAIAYKSKRTVKRSLFGVLFGRIKDALPIGKGRAKVQKIDKTYSTNQIIGRGKFKGIVNKIDIIPLSMNKWTKLLSGDTTDVAKIVKEAETSNKLPEQKPTLKDKIKRFFGFGDKKQQIETQQGQVQQIESTSEVKPRRTIGGFIKGLFGIKPKAPKPEEAGAMSVVPSAPTSLPDNVIQPTTETPRQRRGLFSFISDKISNIRAKFAKTPSEGEVATGTTGAGQPTQSEIQQKPESDYVPTIIPREKNKTVVIKGKKQPPSLLKTFSKFWPKGGYFYVPESFKRAFSTAKRKAGELIKKVWTKVKQKAKEVIKRVWGAIKRVVAKVAKAVWKVAKKVVAATYRAVTKGVVAGTKIAGNALRSVGQSVAAIPVVGWILGPILIGIGTGLTALSGALRVTFQVIGKVSQALAKVIENAVANIAKLKNRINKSSSVAQAKNAAKKMAEGVASFVPGADLLIAAQEFSPGALKNRISAFFTGVGKKIKGFFDGIKFNSYNKTVSKAVEGLKLKAVPPNAKYHARYGNSDVRKESESVIMSAYDNAIRLHMDATSSGFMWSQNIMRTLATSMADIVSSLGRRLSVLSTVGFKGFIKSLLNPMFLIPLGIVLILLFRKKIFPFIGKIALGFVRNIGKILRGIWVAVKTAWKWFKAIGLFLFKFVERETDPRNKITFTSTLIFFGKLLLKGILKIVKSAMKVFPGAPTANGYLLGMALGGYVWPLIGMKILKTIDNVIQWIKGAVFWFFFENPFNILTHITPNIIKRGIAKVLKINKTVTVEAVDLDKAMDEYREANAQTLNQLKASNKYASVNAALTKVGLPDLDKMLSTIGKNAESNNSAIKNYTEFIKKSTEHLTDINHVAYFTSKYFANPDITSALLSVFFFTDPISGKVVSTIPRGNIPGVVKKFGEMIASARNKPKRLVEVNRKILTYLDFMNVRRSKIIEHILQAVHKDIDKIASAKNSKSPGLAKKIAEKIRSNGYAIEALSAIQKETIEDMKKDSTKGDKHISATTGGKLSDISGLMASSTSLPDAGGNMRNISKPEKYSEKKLKVGGYDANFVMGTKVRTAKWGQTGNLSTDVSEKRQEIKYKRDKRYEWLQYKYRREVALDRGATSADLEKMGLHLNQTEWERKYDAEHANMPGSPEYIKKHLGATNAVSVKSGITPKQATVKPPAPPQPPKFKLPTFKQTNISIPGLTRDITEGSAEHNLYKLSLRPKKKSFSDMFKQSREEEAYRRQKRYEWLQYKYRREQALEGGASQAELDKMGLGMDQEQWSKQYDATHEQPKKISTGDGEVELKEGPKVVETKAEEEKEEQPDSKTKNAVTGKIKGGMDESVLTGLEKQQKVMADTLGKLNSDITVFKDKKKDNVPETSFGVTNESGEIPSLTLPETVSKFYEPKTEKLSFKDRLLWKFNSFLGKPKEMTKKDMGMTDEEFKAQGVSVSNDLQQVSAQEAFVLEQRLFNEARDIHDIIFGLNVMHKRIDTAKSEVSEKLDRISKNPVGKVINSPPNVVTQPISFVDPDKDKDYDPLPALG